jgi:hypothetical protein
MLLAALDGRTIRVAVVGHRVRSSNIAHLIGAANRRAGDVPGDVII